MPDDKRQAEEKQRKVELRDLEMERDGATGGGVEPSPFRPDLRTLISLSPDGPTLTDLGADVLKVPQIGSSQTNS